MRGLISITCSPTSWMLKKCSMPSSATIVSASSISDGSSSGQQRERLLQPHRDRARAFVQQLVRAVDRRVEHAEAARARREDRLEADRALRVAELMRCRLDLACPAYAPECRRRQSEPVQQ